MFENILGNERNKDILEKAIELNKVSHSYIFWGTEGIGKKAYSKSSSQKEFYVCKIMIMIVNANHVSNLILTNNPDFQLIESSDGKIKIEQIRADAKKNC